MNTKMKRDFLTESAFKRALEGSKMEEAINKGFRRQYNSGKATAALDVLKEITRGIENNYSDSHILFNIACTAAAIAEVYGKDETPKEDTNSKPEVQEVSAKDLFASE